MAQGIVVKIWNVTAGANTRSASAQIKDSIAYIENPEKVGKPLKIGAQSLMKNELTYVTNDLKTVNGLYVGCRHLTDISNATEEMMQVKKFYGKTDGRVATHGVISLDESESDSKNAGKLMLLLSDVMQQVFPDNQVVYAVHTNTENLHIHFIINTVGLNGKKIHMDKKFMREVLEPTVNRLAEKYGFTPNETWRKERVTDPLTLTQRKIFLRKQIDLAIEQTDAFDAFVAFLRAKGLTVNVGRQISLQSEDMPKAMQTGKLGENYSLEAISERLMGKYDPLQKGKAGIYYEAILPEEMVKITPYKMKKYKDMTAEERTETVRLLKLKRNPWQESFRDNWQMQKMSDELKQISYIYKLSHFYSNGTDKVSDALAEIAERRKSISEEKKELRDLLKKHKPEIDIYEEMKQYMVRAYLYDAYERAEFEEDFLKYKELTERLKASYDKDVEEVADFVSETKAEIFYLKAQEQELSKQYVAIKKFSESGELKAYQDEYSFFYAIGHSKALYDAKEYGIYATDLKIIKIEGNDDVTIRVVTTPDMNGGKPTVSTAVSVISKDGINLKEFSSKDMEEKAFYKAIYEVQSEYNIKKCSISRNKLPQNARQI